MLFLPLCKQNVRQYLSFYLTLDIVQFVISQRNGDMSTWHGHCNYNYASMALKEGGIGMKYVFLCNSLKFFLAVLFIVSVLLTVSAHTEESAEVAKGKELFQSKGCVACHTIGSGKLTGPDLKGVTERRQEEWLKQWIKSPDTMVFSDPIAKELLAEYMVPMPNQGLTDQEVIEVITYLKYEDSKK